MAAEGRFGELDGAGAPRTRTPQERDELGGLEAAGTP